MFERVPLLFLKFNHEQLVLSCYTRALPWYTNSHTISFALVFHGTSHILCVGLQKTNCHPKRYDEALHRWWHYCQGVPRAHFSTNIISVRILSCLYNISFTCAIPSQNGECAYVLSRPASNEIVHMVQIVDGLYSINQDISIPENSMQTKHGSGLHVISYCLFLKASDAKRQFWGWLTQVSWTCQHWKAIRGNRQFWHSAQLYDANNPK